MTKRVAVKRSRGCGVALACGALAYGFGAMPALADEPGPDALPITVVAVQTEDAYDQAEALTKALRNAVRGTRGWSLGEGDYALEVLTLSLKCSDPPDSSCESRIADQIKADRYVWGVIKKKGADVQGDLHLWVRGKGSTKVDLSYSANLTEPADDSLRRVAANAVEQLTGGAPQGGVLVKAGSVAGQVFIDGTPVGALTGGQGTFPLTSGPHKIVVKAQGYADTQAPVMVRPNATVEIVMNPIPMAAEEPTNYRRIGGYAGIGLGVVAAGVGVLSMVQVNGVQNDEKFVAYRDSTPEAQDVCENAESAGNGNDQYVADLCGKASTFELMQAIMFPVAAVAGGLGVYLLATSDTSAPQTTGLHVTPQIGVNAGRVDLTYSF